MNDDGKLEETEKVSCELCLKEIPRSEAKNVEVNDYLLHFCGLDCYDKWKEEGKKR